MNSQPAPPSLSPRLESLKAELTTINDELAARIDDKGKAVVLLRPSDPNHSETILAGLTAAAGLIRVPTNDQHGFIHSRAKERWLIGGVRSGKTHATCYDIYLTAVGRHPIWSDGHVPPVQLRVCGPKWRENVKGVLVAKFKKMVPRTELKGQDWREGWSEADHKLYFDNGSWIQFMSYDQDPDTFDSETLDAVMMDEPPPFWVYHKNKARLAETDGYMVCSMAAEQGISWQKAHIYNPAKGASLEHWQFNAAGNPHLDAGGVRELAQVCSRDPALFITKIMGGFASVEGMCIPQYDRKVHVIPDRDIKRGSYRVFCIDTHPQAPCAMLWGAWEPGGALIIYRAFKDVKTIPEWQKAIKTASMDDGPIHLWLGDEPSAKDVNSLGQKSILQQFREGENPIPLIQVPKLSGSVLQGIMMLRTAFSVDPVNGTAGIYIFESCNHEVKFFGGKPNGSLPWELEQWAFRAEKAADGEILRERPIEVGIHYCSDLRYMIMAGPGRANLQVKSAMASDW